MRIGRQPIRSLPRGKAGKPMNKVLFLREQPASIGQQLALRFAAHAR
jgi:hypothetical protein